MPIRNPLSVPGGWKKDTPADTPAVEEPDPVESQTIPRTPAGVVSESGSILDEAGHAIGRITESEDGRSLVGNPVTATGDVLDKSTGDLLGRASLSSEDSGKEDEYMTDGMGARAEDVQSEKSGSGFFGSVKSGLGGFVGGSKKSDPDLPAASANKNTDDVQDTAQDTAEGKDKPVETDDKPSEEGEGGDDLTSQAPITIEDQEKSGDKERDVEDFKDDANIDDDKLQSDTNLPQSESGAAKTTERAAEGGGPEQDLPEGSTKGEDVEAADVKAPSPKTGSDVAEDNQADNIAEKLTTGEDVEGVADKTAEQTSENIGDKADNETIDKATEDTSDNPSDEKDLEKAADDAADDAIDKAAPGDEAEITDDATAADDAEAEAEKTLDFTILKGCKVNKTGNLVDDNGNVVGHVTEGDPKKLQGKRSDEEGNIWSDAGKIIGKAEPISESERDNRKKDFAPFENFPDAIVEADGRVMSEGRQVGAVVEGDPKRLKGSKVDEDGDILDRNGNVVGRAEAWDEPEPEPEVVEEAPDRSILAGKRVNKAGNVVDSSGTIFGRVVEGAVSSIVGRMCDKDGNIRSESGDIIGRAEVVPESEREGSKEGPFVELSGLTVRKDGMVVTPSDEVVGRLISGDAKKLSGRAVDEDGDVVDKNGNVLGKAERYEELEEVVEEKKKGPLFGRKVNKDGNVADEDGNIIAKLVAGDLLVCSGKEIDDDGDVINSKGNTVGHVALLEDIPEPEPEEPEETEEEKKAREEAEQDRKLAGSLAGCIEQSLEKIKPICRLITDKIDKAERTPKEELDEEQLVKEVRPLIEEGGKILTESNGIIRGMDPDGRIQRQAKQRSGTKEATPEEHHLAEVLKELTGDVSQCVDNAKRKIEGMPHAKKELNPLWGLLMEPLGQILAAVGLLLTGVLGLVGRLLSGLGLGGIVDGLLGGLGLGKILGSLGLGSAYDALVGKKKK